MLAYGGGGGGIDIWHKYTTINRLESIPELFVIFLFQEKMKRQISFKERAALFGADK